MSQLDLADAKHELISPEQQFVILRTLRSVLDSPHFSKSKRYPAFLDFVVRTSLEESCDTLKERDVGARVFGRPLDYETSSDPVVRIAAGEVRKRVALYFSEHPESPVRFDLPLGSYKAEFHFRSEGLIAASERAASPTLTMHTPKSTFLGRSAKFWVTLSALLIIVAGAGMWRHFRNQAQRQFWLPVLRGNQPTQILVGKTKMPDSIATTINHQEAAAYGPGGPPNLALDDAIVAAQICSTIREYGPDCKVVEGQLAKVEDIQKKSAVVIGGFNNPWTSLLLAPLPYKFQFDKVARVRSVVEQKPTGDVQLGQIADNETDPGKDYAIIARFHSDITDSMVVVVGGVGIPGTSIAGQYVTSPDKSKDILSQAPKNWGGINLEAVLKIDVVQGNAGRVQVIASHFW